MNNLFPFILQIGLGEDNKDQIPNTNVTCNTLSSSCFKKCQTPKYWSHLKKKQISTTAVLWQSYDHVYVYIYKNPTGMMENYMVTKAVKQCLEIMLAESHSRKKSRHIS